MKWIVFALLLVKLSRLAALPERFSIANLVSELASAPQPNPVVDVPVIGAIAETIPALRELPGLSFIPKPIDDQTYEIRNMNNAIEQFTTPLLRLASGDPFLMAEDLDQMFSAAPKLIGKSRIDLSQLPPELVVKTFRGESIPGFEKETVNESLREYTLKIYKAAAMILDGHSLLDRPNLLLILNGLPQEIVADVVKGAKLPYLTDKQMEVIKEYYGADITLSNNETPKGGLSLADLELSPELFRMMKFLPKGYDISRIPKEVIQSISRGELPNLGLLPADLQHYFVANFQRLFAEFTRKDLRVEDVIKILPTFERMQATTFSPYDTKSAERYRGKHAQIHEYFGHYAMIVVGLMGFVSAVVLGTFCFYRRRVTVDADEREANSFGVSTPKESQPELTLNRATSHFPSFYGTPRCEFPNFSQKTQ